MLLPGKISRSNRQSGVYKEQEYIERGKVADKKGNSTQSESKRLSRAKLKAIEGENARQTEREEGKERER